MAKVSYSPQMMEVSKQEKAKQAHEDLEAKEDSVSSSSSRFCPVVESLRIVGNEKKLIIIRFLLDRPMRFNELLHEGIDSKTLSRALKSLESQGIVKREVLTTQPFSVQYSLTEMGMELKPVIDSLRKWSERWIVPRVGISSSSKRESGED